jgi:hypothetical protein
LTPRRSSSAAICRSDSPCSCSTSTTGIDAPLGEGAVKVLLGWYDATTRPEMTETLRVEAARESMIRMLRQPAGAAVRTA